MVSVIKTVKGKEVKIDMPDEMAEKLIAKDPRYKLAEEKKAAPVKAEKKGNKPEEV